MLTFYCGVMSAVIDRNIYATSIKQEYYINHRYLLLASKTKKLKNIHFKKK